jgi:hypothetical protein
MDDKMQMAHIMPSATPLADWACGPVQTRPQSSMRFHPITFRYAIIRKSAMNENHACGKTIHERK